MKYENPRLRFSEDGRKAYLEGHEVAVSDVVDLYAASESTEATADHFHLPNKLIRRALAHHEQVVEGIRQFNKADSTGPTGDNLLADIA